MGKNEKNTSHVSSKNETQEVEQVEESTADYSPKVETQEYTGEMLGNLRRNGKRFSKYQLITEEEKKDIIEAGLSNLIG